MAADLVTIDGVVDSILADTATIVWANITTIDGIVDSILADTATIAWGDITTLLARLSAARAGYLDQLDFALQEKLLEIDAEVEGLGGAAMRGTNNAALAATLEDAMQKAAGPAYNQDTDSLEALREAIDALVAGATAAQVWAYVPKAWPVPIPGFGDASDGNRTVSANEDLGAQQRDYDNLTIDATYTLSGYAGHSFIFVKTLLTVNGTLSADGLGGAGGVERTHAQGGGTGAAGGAGAGVLFIFARRITGTGAIRAVGTPGAAGGDGVAPSGTVAGIDGLPGEGAKHDVTTYGAAGGGEKGKITSAPKVGGPGGAAGATIPKVIHDYFADVLPNLFYPNPHDVLGGGGGSGGSGSATQAAGGSTSGGGGGGSGAMFAAGKAGGKGGDTTGNIQSTSGGGGGGGGGGGLIFTITPSIDGVTLEADGGEGGDGGDGYAAAGAGGGGGGGGSGGRIILLSQSISGVTETVAGGALGAGGTPGGGSADPGDDGIVGDAGKVTEITF